MLGWDMPLSGLCPTLVCGTHVLIRFPVLQTSEYVPVLYGGY